MRSKKRRQTEFDKSDMNKNDHIAFHQEQESSRERYAIKELNGPAQFFCLQQTEFPRKKERLNQILDSFKFPPVWSFFFFFHLATPHCKESRMCSFLFLSKYINYCLTSRNENIFSLHIEI